MKFFALLVLSPIVIGKLHVTNDEMWNRITEPRIAAQRDRRTSE